MPRVFKPLGSKVMLAREQFKYDGKIVIPEIGKSKSSVGEVVAVGPEVTKFVHGDKVLFSRLCGLHVTTTDRNHPRAHPDTGEVEWIIMDQDEIICMVEDVGELGGITNEQGYTA